MPIDQVPYLHHPCHIMKVQFTAGQNGFEIYYLNESGSNGIFVYRENEKSVECLEEIFGISERGGEENSI